MDRRRNLGLPLSAGSRPTVILLINFGYFRGERSLLIVRFKTWQGTEVVSLLSTLLLRVWLIVHASRPANLSVFAFWGGPARFTHFQGVWPDFVDSSKNFSLFRSLWLIQRHKKYTCVFPREQSRRDGVRFASSSVVHLEISAVKWKAVPEKSLSRTEYICEMWFSVRLNVTQLLFCLTRGTLGEGKNTGLIFALIGRVQPLVMSPKLQFQPRLSSWETRWYRIPKKVPSWLWLRTPNRGLSVPLL